MSQTVSKRRPYVRSMDGWWKKNPFFVEYIAHEGTAVFVASYALILLAGVICLFQGEASWNGWLAAMQSPLSLIVHIVLLAAIIYHAVSWFKIMPRTLPPIMLGDKKLPACAIVTGGMAASIVCNVALIVIVLGVLL